MSMQEPLYMISYDEGKEVFNESMNRFADFYGMTLTEVLASAKCLRPAAFRNELQKYAARYEKSLEEVMAHEGSHGVTLPAGGRYIVLVKYERDESNFAEKIRETTYHNWVMHCLYTRRIYAIPIERTHFRIPGIRIWRSFSTSETMSGRSSLQNTWPLIS